MNKIAVSRPTYILLAAALGGLCFVGTSFLFGHLSALHWASLIAIVFFGPRALRKCVTIVDPPSDEQK